MPLRPGDRLNVRVPIESEEVLPNNLVEPYSPPLSVPARWAGAEGVDCYVRGAGQHLAGNSQGREGIPR
jgi:hypothetical protein